MADQGILTVLGLLYEGSDFAAWKAKLRSLLRQQGLDLDDLIKNKRQTFQTLFKRNVIMHSVISKSVTSRLPGGDDDLDTKTLLQKLEGRAKPFRFMDLPAELRNLIYTFVVPTCQRMRDPFTEAQSIKPYLLQTCSQIRAEASPLYYNQCEFRFYFRSSHDKLDFDEMAGLLRSWVGQCVGKHVKHLRQVRLAAGVISGRWTLAKATWSENDGLVVKANRAPAFESKVHDHVQDIKATARALGFSGEAIIVALTTNISTWKQAFAWPTVEDIRVAVPHKGILSTDFNRFFMHEINKTNGEFNKLIARAGVRERYDADGLCYNYTV